MVVVEQVQHAVDDEQCQFVLGRRAALARLAAAPPPGTRPRHRAASADPPGSAGVPGPASALIGLAARPGGTRRRSGTRARRSGRSPPRKRSLSSAIVVRRRRTATTSRRRRRAARSTRSSSSTSCASRTQRGTSTLLQDPVGGEPDRILDPLVFQVLVDPWHGEGRVGAEIDARDLAPIARHDRVEHVLPAVSAVDVAGTQRTAFEITKLVEHEQRMVAGAVVSGRSRRSSPARHGSG